MSPRTQSVGDYLEAWTRLKQGKSYRQVEQPVGDLYRGLNFSISPSEDYFLPEMISSPVVIVQPRLRRQCIQTVFVQVSQGHAGSSWGVASRDITPDSHSSFFFMPQQLETGRREEDPTHRACTSLQWVPLVLPTEPDPWQPGAAEGAQG